MPIDYSKYPSDWPEIRARILKRDGNACKFCGAENYEPHPITGSRVILTVAHLDHDLRNCEDWNLAALCQRCHLKYDLGQHLHSRAVGKQERMIAAGQMYLL